MPFLLPCQLKLLSRVLLNKIELKQLFTAILWAC